MVACLPGAPRYQYSLETVAYVCGEQTQYVVFARVGKQTCARNVCHTDPYPRLRWHGNSRGGANSVLNEKIMKNEDGAFVFSSRLESSRATKGSEFPLSGSPPHCQGPPPSFCHAIFCHAKKTRLFSRCKTKSSPRPCVFVYVFQRPVLYHVWDNHSHAILGPTTFS